MLLHPPADNPYMVFPQTLTQLGVYFDRTAAIFEPVAQYIAAGISKLTSLQSLHLRDMPLPLSLLASIRDLRELHLANVAMAADSTNMQLLSGFIALTSLTIDQKGVEGSCCLADITAKEAEAVSG